MLKDDFLNKYMIMGKLKNVTVEEYSEFLKPLNENTKIYLIT